MQEQLIFSSENVNYLLKLNCVISAPLLPPNGIAKIITAFKQVSQTHTIGWKMSRCLKTATFHSHSIICMGISWESTYKCIVFSAYLTEIEESVGFLSWLKLN